MVQIPLRRAHRLRAIILASPTKKLRPQSTERAPTAWHTNDEYTNAEAPDEASAGSAVANVSENKILRITHVLLLTSGINPALISVSTQWGPSMTDWSCTAPIDCSDWLPMRRIATLRADIDETVARHVNAVAKECRSIPEGVIERV